MKYSYIQALLDCELNLKLYLTLQMPLSFTLSLVTNLKVNYIFGEVQSSHMNSLQAKNMTKDIFVI